MKSYLISPGEVLGASTVDAVETQTTFAPQIETTTAFDQKQVEEYEAIPFEIEYVEDDELEYGLEEIQTPGVEGLRTNTYLVTYWIDDIIDKLLTDTVIEDPVTQIVSKGTKIIWREMDTPEYGKIKYWRKMTVWATKYDSTCEGCNNTTALGAPVQEGVCAVDPTTIAMYTHFYIPGYGKCQALDVGGAIKGNEIDMAFRDHRTTSWGAGYKEIYLMDNEPQ
jgi:3D (Asp-Asp-Asp) domain-containing protein